MNYFLSNPLDNSSFNHFFKYCYKLTKDYLHFLKKYGWKLPLEKASTEESISDIAYDILGPFLASKKDRPFYVIFDYFERHGIRNFSEIEEERLLEHLKILLRGFIKRELTEIKSVESPQEAKLKRRVEYALDKLGAVKTNQLGVKQKCVYLNKYERELRKDAPMMPSEMLQEIVNRAFYEFETYKVEDWCRHIFVLVNDESEYCNMVRNFELQSIMTQIYSEHVEAFGVSHGSVEGATDKEIDSRLKLAIEKSLKKVCEIEVSRFEAKKVLSPVDSALLMKACRAYLDDKHLNGGAKALPWYFKQFKQNVTQKDYLKRWKYIFETLIMAADDGLKNFL